MTHTLAGFEDYGAYWRYNYETIGETGEYSYTRDDLMNDVRSIYKQVFLSVVCLVFQSIFLRNMKNVKWVTDCGKRLMTIMSCYLTDPAVIQGAACICESQAHGGLQWTH